MQHQIEQKTKQIREFEGQLDEQRVLCFNCSASLTFLQAQLNKMQASAQEESKGALRRTTMSLICTGMDKLLQQRSNLAIRKEECFKKIRDLGTLPADAQKYVITISWFSHYARYAGTSVKELLKQLNTVNEKLKKYSHVNKKAYDQFVNFSEQRSTLLVRLEEAQTSAKVNACHYNYVTHAPAEN